MIKVRKANERGHFNFGWLDTSHTFSFADYYDPAHMGWRSLRVINEDYIHGGGGFPSHYHRDMEIITYILEGALEHRDSMGNGSIIRPGEVQRMTAGTGVTHSERNPSPTDTVHLLQIWILPAQRGLPPEYEQQTFTDEQKRGQLCLVASEDGRDGSVTIHQDANVYSSVLDAGQELTHALGAERHAWLQVARGSVTLNEQPLEPGDGAAISGENLQLKCSRPAELLLFDLA